MEEEKMVELKIKVPARWMNFVNEYFGVTGRNPDEELHDNFRAMIEMFIGDLDAKDKVRLVDKYQLGEVYEIPQWVRDEAADIPRPAKVISPWEKVVDMLVDNPKFMESYHRLEKSARLNNFIAALDVLSPEEMVEVKAAAPIA